jgi:hypothetical protein
MTSTALPDRLPGRHPDVEVVAFPGAIVVFDIRNRMAHELRGTPAAIFDACCERASASAFTEELVAEGTGDAEEVRALLSSALADFAELGLLEGCEAPTPPPCLECGGEPAGRWRRRGR